MNFALFMFGSFFIAKPISKVSAQQMSVQETNLDATVSESIFPANSGSEIIYTKSAGTSKNADVTSPQKPAISGGGIGQPGPILSEFDVVNGKRVCGYKNDHPQKSKKNSPGHIDAECCLDPDEIPNSLCYYPQKKYAGIMQRYLSSGK